MNLQAYCFRKLFVLEVITLNVLFKIKYGNKPFLKIWKSGTKISYFSANGKMCDLILFNTGLHNMDPDLNKVNLTLFIYSV